MTEDRFTSNLGDELKGWTDPKVYKVITPIRTKKESADWVNHLSDLRDEMRGGDIIIWPLGRGNLAREQDFRTWEAVDAMVRKLPLGVRSVVTGINDKTDKEDKWMAGKVNCSIANVNTRMYKILQKYPLDTLFVPIVGLRYGDYWGLGQRTPGKPTRVGLIKVASAIVDGIRRTRMV